ncbi:MAG: phosphonate metabolism transcriptional regulator PhnF [Alphaproteobacteria bacterium]|nr:phosphonate metabolism transcriptional regulator PhnF [Alphaproteobacteria bacterium]
MVTVLDRANGVAIWRQIEQELAQEIATGVFQEGQQLPTEAELAARFSVNRHTIRRAVGMLSDRGLVRVEQGRGSFVRENVLEYTIGRRTRFTENVKRANRSPGGRMLSITREKASRGVAEELDVTAGAQVVHLVSVSEVDGRPVGLADHYFPTKLFGEFEAAYAREPSITKVMEHHGFGDYQRARTKVTAGIPDAVDSSVLQIPRTRPVLIVDSVNVAPGGTILQASHVRYAADRFQLVFETLDSDLKTFS